uniref:Uncharacterized protein n=1 Tax=Arundo donax TaxID=35708 RepID=A0A0A9H3F2_ARUDO
MSQTSGGGGGRPSCPYARPTRGAPAAAPIREPDSAKQQLLPLPILD